MRNKNEILELECEFLILGCGANIFPILVKKKWNKKEYWKGSANAS